MSRRTPRGVRGLKPVIDNLWAIQSGSHPSRGAWIETVLHHRAQNSSTCRTPRGVRGLKLWNNFSFRRVRSRTPRGVRGLKRCSYILKQTPLNSHPSRGAWIETSTSSILWVSKTGRTPRGVRGLKLVVLSVCTSATQSHPSRGAWIETRWSWKSWPGRVVAPLAGCVD